MQQFRIEYLCIANETKIVSKYNVGMKTLLLQGLLETEFYGDLVHEFRKIIGNNDFSYHYKKILARYKRLVIT